MHTENFNKPKPQKKFPGEYGKLLFTREFIYFLISGGTAAAVNFFSRIILNYWLSFSTSIIIAYILGMFTAFTANRLFVFTNSTQTLRKSAIYFILVNILAMAQAWLFSILIYYYVFPVMQWKLYPREFAHAIGIVIPVFSSYLGHKYYSFKQ